MEDLEKRAEELAKLEQEQTLQEKDLVQSPVVVGNVQNALVDSSAFEEQVRDNQFVNTMTDNAVAVQMAKEQYGNIKNQKSIAKGIKDVAIDNTKTEIDSAKIKVEEKKKNNKVKRQEINNELFRLKKEREYLEKDQKHRLEMQRAQHLKEKYEDLLLRTCRKKQKGEDGKYHFVNDKDGNPIVNIPSKFRFFWIRLFDGIVSTLNQTAEIFGALNKNVLKGGLIIIILLLLLVPPFRNWIFGLIGVKF